MVILNLMDSVEVQDRHGPVVNEYGGYRKQAAADVVTVLVLGTWERVRKAIGASAGWLYQD